MVRHFGLRQKECLLSHKMLTIVDKELLVVEGSKGGRSRVITSVAIESAQGISETVVETTGMSQRTLEMQQLAAHSL